MRIATEPIRLNYRDSDTQVLVEPSDEDRFIISASEVAEACRQNDKAIRFLTTLQKHLLPRLGQWLSQHSDRVRSAWLSVRDGSLLFVVVRRQAAYDRQFEDALTELDLEIANCDQMDGICLNVLALPNVSDETACSFLDPAVVWEFARADD